MKKILLIFLLLLLSACSLGSQQNNMGAEKEKITLKLKWLHQSQFAGNYMAKEKGFYDEAGFDVALEPFSFEDPTLKAVAEGRAEFGITGADELILARAEGVPIQAIAVIYKVNPVCAYSLASSNIKKPQDFIGKTVGLERASDGTEINIGILYKTMMAKLGIDRSKINEITIGYDPSELLLGKTDVSTGYIINEPNLAVEQGYAVNTILMADYGANMYADVLFATEELIKTRPDLVNSFVKATLDGWQYAIANVDESVKTVLKYAPDRTVSHETYMLESSIPLINSNQNPIGWMEKSAWQDVINTMYEQKMLKTRPNTDEVYNNNFVKTAYQK
jgi:NitT/TauT family transport system substrate-binding protein